MTYSEREGEFTFAKNKRKIEKSSTGWIARVREHKILVQNAPGRPKLTWDELVKRDRVLLGMERTDPKDRQAWRGRLRPRLGSQAAPSAED